MQSEFLDLVFFYLLVVSAGLLVYFRPRSLFAARLRVTSLLANGCSLAFLFVHTTVVDRKDGGFVALVFDPTGVEWIVPHPYDYYLFYRTLRVIRVVCFSIALVCPIVYLFKLRAGTR
jgi:hypothetical protein